MEIEKKLLNCLIPSPSHDCQDGQQSVEGGEAAGGPAGGRAPGGGGREVPERTSALERKAW